MPGALPFRLFPVYASGMFGWSIFINIQAVMLIYFYLPPEGVGLKELVPQTTLFLIFNWMSLLAASGRLWDAVTDPLVAWLSDRASFRSGRRIPFLRFSPLPTLLFFLLMFVPLSKEVSSANIGWLFGTQLLFFLFITAYAIPYNALMPELARNDSDRVKLSVWQSFAFVLGIIFSSQTPLFADYLGKWFDLPNRMAEIQLSIGLLGILGCVAMLIPAFIIDEKKFCSGRFSAEALFPALRHTLAIRNFRLFIVADFAYFMAVALISSSLLYYVTVLLGLQEAIGGFVMGAMVLFSLLFYPFIPAIAQRQGKKKLIIGSLLAVSAFFGFSFFLGKLPFPPEAQIFGLALLFSLPLAFLGILPNAILAAIAKKDGLETGQPQEGMFYAVRNLVMKSGQTLGMMLFAMLTLYGKDPGNDLGVRLTGVFGFLFCLAAAGIFWGFKEEEIQNAEEG